MFQFDLQRFGGKGGTVVESAKPTAQELRLQDVQANYAEKTAKSALDMQSLGSNMILQSPGIVPVDYTQYGNQAVAGAQGLINQSANLGTNISGMTGQNTQNINSGTAALNSLSGQNQNNATAGSNSVSYTHLRAHETDSYLVCRL